MQQALHGFTRTTGATLAARRDPRENDMVADSEVRDVGTYRGYDSTALVPENEWCSNCLLYTSPSPRDS